MSFLKILKPHLFYVVLRDQKPSFFRLTPHINSHSYQFISRGDSIFPSSVYQRKFSSDIQLDSPDEHAGTVSEDKGSSEAKNNGMMKRIIEASGEAKRSSKTMGDIKITEEKKKKIRTVPKGKRSRKTMGGIKPTDEEIKAKKEKRREKRREKRKKNKMRRFDVLFKEAIGRISNLPVKKGSSFMFESKQPCLYQLFTSEPENSHQSLKVHIPEPETKQP